MATDNSQQQPKANGNGSDSQFDSDNFEAIVARSLSALGSRAALAAQLNQTFGTKRDINAILGYANNLSISDYLYRYKRGGLAKRIIEIYPKYTWLGGDLVIWEEEDNDIQTKFELQIQDLDSRLDLRSKFYRADVACNLGRYSALFIGAKGTWSEELPRLRGPQDVFTLTPLTEEKCLIESLEENISDKRFGLPAYYTITLGGQSQKVHWSRVIHIAEDTLEDDVYGQPRLQSVWNYIDDLVKIVGGGGEAAWIRANPGMQFNTPLFDKDGRKIEIPKDKLEKFQEQVDKYIHGMSRVLFTRETDINLLQSPVHNFGPNADTILQLITATLGVPLRILLGSERGELASSQDRNNMNDRVTERRNSFAWPTIIKQLIDRLITYGAIVKPKDGKYQITWPEREELTEKEKAEVAKLESEAKVKTVNEIRESVYNLEPLDEDELNETNESATNQEQENEEEQDQDQEQDQDDDSEPIARAAASFDLADVPADEPEWKSLHRVADSHVESLAIRIINTWRDAAADLDTNSLETTLLGTNVVDIRSALSIVNDDDRSLRLNRVLAQPMIVIDNVLSAANDSLSDMFSDRLLTIVDDGAMAALRSAKARGGFKKLASNGEGKKTSDDVFRSLRFSFNFDTKNPRAITFAELRSAELVKEIISSCRAAIRDLIAEGLKEGIAPRALVKQVKQVVGLRSDQIRALNNYVNKLVSKGVDGERLDKLVSKYAKKLHSDRAILISRTETLRSANEGQKELWRQAQDNDQLPHDQKRVWITTPDDRLRASHAAMEGQETSIDKPFDPIAEPGSEPNCRCAQGLV